MSNYKYDSDYTFKTDANPNKKYKGIFKEQEGDEEPGGEEVEGMSAIRKDLMTYNNKWVSVTMGSINNTNTFAINIVGKLRTAGNFTKIIGKNNHITYFINSKIKNFKISENLITFEYKDTTAKIFLNMYISLLSKVV